MKVSVQGPRVLVKPYKLEEVDEIYKKIKAAGLEIPETDEKRREQAAVEKGVVVSIGSLAYKDWGDGTPWCRVGDSVVWARYAGKVIAIDGVDHYILNDEDIIAVTSEGH